MFREYLAAAMKRAKNEILSDDGTYHGEIPGFQGVLANAMPPFGPISRQALIAALRRAGLEGPYAGRRPQIMIQGGRRVSIPNPLAGTIGRELLARVLRQADITRAEWELL